MNDVIKSKEEKVGSRLTILSFSCPGNNTHTCTHTHTHTRMFHNNRDKTCTYIIPEKNNKRRRKKKRRKKKRKKTITLSKHEREIERETEARINA